MAGGVSKPATESRLLNIQEFCEPLGVFTSSKLTNATNLGFSFFFLSEIWFTSTLSVTVSIK